MPRKFIALAATAADLDGVTAVAERRFAGWGGGLIAGTPGQVAASLAALSGRGVERFYLGATEAGRPLCPEYAVWRSGYPT